MQTDSQVLKRYSDINPWGIATSIDLYSCNPKTIRSAKKIKEFINKVCELIQVRKFGKTNVINFGEDPRVAGYSMTQLIETSLISGHFANESNAVYLDIFSCKYYPPLKIAEFSKIFFEAEKMKIKINFRI